MSVSFQKVQQHPLPRRARIFPPHVHESREAETPLFQGRFRRFADASRNYHTGPSFCMYVLSFACNGSKTAPDRTVKTCNWTDGMYMSTADDVKTNSMDRITTEKAEIGKPKTMGASRLSVALERQTTIKRSARCERTILRATYVLCLFQVARRGLRR